MSAGSGIRSRREVHQGEREFEDHAAIPVAQGFGQLDARRMADVVGWIDQADEEAETVAEGRVDRVDGQAGSTGRSGRDGRPCASAGRLAESLAVVREKYEADNSLEP